MEVTNRNDFEEIPDDTHVDKTEENKKQTPPASDNEDENGKLFGIY